MYVEHTDWLRFEPNINKIEINSLILNYEPQTDREDVLFRVLKPFLDDFFSKPSNTSRFKKKWLELALIVKFMHSRGTPQKTSEELFANFLLLVKLPRLIEEIALSQFRYYSNVNHTVLSEIRDLKNKIIRGDI